MVFVRVASAARIPVVLGLLLIVSAVVVVVKVQAVVVVKIRWSLQMTMIFLIKNGAPFTKMRVLGLLPVVVAG